MAVHFTSAGRTDRGKVRQRNEDAILVRDAAGLWVVADGLGGHPAGDYASSMIVERLAALPRRGDGSGFVESVEDTLGDVNTDLRRTAMARGVDVIASTVVVLVHDRDCMLCGWAGDSRVYCFENGHLTQITRDHVYGVDNSVTEFFAGSRRPQPGAGVLTRAVGAEATLSVDWVRVPASPGTMFVLCSDGLNKEMNDDEIAAVCGRHGSPSAIVDELFATSLGRNGRDNISAVVVRWLA